jgi:hypothetical protein
MGPFVTVYTLRTTDREMLGTDDDTSARWTISRVWPPES